MRKLLSPSSIFRKSKPSVPRPESFSRPTVIELSQDDAPLVLRMASMSTEDSPSTSPSKQREVAPSKPAASPRPAIKRALAPSSSSSPSSVASSPRSASSGRPRPSEPRTARSESAGRPRPSELHPPRADAANSSLARSSEPPSRPRPSEPRSRPTVRAAAPSSIGSSASATLAPSGAAAARKAYDGRFRGSTPSRGRSTSASRPQPPGRASSRDSTSADPRPASSSYNGPGTRPSARPGSMARPRSMTPQGQRRPGASQDFSESFKDAVDRRLSRPSVNRPPESPIRERVSTPLRARRVPQPSKPKAAGGGGEINEPGSEEGASARELLRKCQEERERRLEFVKETKKKLAAQRAARAETKASLEVTKEKVAQLEAQSQREANKVRASAATKLQTRARIQGAQKEAQHRRDARELWQRAKAATKLQTRVRLQIAVKEVVAQRNRLKDRKALREAEWAQHEKDERNHAADQAVKAKATEEVQMKAVRRMSLEAEAAARRNHNALEELTVADVVEHKTMGSFDGKKAFSPPSSPVPLAAAASTEEPKKTKKTKGQLTRPGEEEEKDLLDEALQKGLGVPPKAEGEAKIVLSEEEREMNGAPDGELFVVEVLMRNDLEPFSPGEDPALALSIALDSLAAETAPAWNIQFEGLTALRRLLAFKPEVLDEGAIGRMVGGVEQCCRNSRSSLAKNALLCVDDLFLACNSTHANPQPLLGADLNSMSALVAACLERCSSSQAKPIRVAALATLEQSTAPGTTLEVLMLLITPLLAQAGHKTKDVASQAMISAEKAMSAVVLADAKFAQKLDLGEVLGYLLAGVNGKVPAGKRAAKLCCLALAKSSGKEAYAAALEASDGLSRLQREELQAAAGMSVKLSVDTTVEPVQEPSARAKPWEVKPKAAPVALRSALKKPALAPDMVSADSRFELPAPPISDGEAQRQARAASSTAAAVEAELATAKAAKEAMEEAFDEEILKKANAAARARKTTDDARAKREAEGAGEEVKDEFAVAGAAAMLGRSSKTGKLSWVAEAALKVELGLGAQAHWALVDAARFEARAMAKAAAAAALQAAAEALAEEEAKANAAEDAVANLMAQIAAIEAEAATKAGATAVAKAVGAVPAAGAAPATTRDDAAEVKSRPSVPRPSSAAAAPLSLSPQARPTVARRGSQTLKDKKLERKRAAEGLVVEAEAAHEAEAEHARAQAQAQAAERSRYRASAEALVHDQLGL